MDKKPSKSEWCGLKDDPELKQCCCNCQYLRPVHYHCSTEPKPTAKELLDAGNAGDLLCVCGVQKGWACCDPECPRVYDNWPQHSCGCENYTPRDLAA